MIWYRKVEIWWGLCEVANKWIPAWTCTSTHTYDLQMNLAIAWNWLIWFLFAICFVLFSSHISYLFYTQPPSAFRVVYGGRFSSLFIVCNFITQKYNYRHNHKYVWINVMRISEFDCWQEEAFAQSPIL